MHDGANRSVVGRSEVSPQGERAGSFAVVGVVSSGRDDPAGPADLLKVNEKGNPLAGLGVSVGQQTWRCTTSPAAVMVVELRCCCCRLDLSYGKKKMSILGWFSHKLLYISCISEYR